MHIGDFLRAAASRPWAWGRDDCSMLLADWVLARRGVDFMAPLRGLYDDERSCARIVEARGGMIAGYDGLLAPHGIERTRDPRAGDIGIIDRSIYLTGAILLPSGRWASRTERGLIMTRSTPVAAWRV